MQSTPRPSASRCPFTRALDLIGEWMPRAKPAAIAQHLRVRVHKDGEERVNVYLPARSARWLIDLIPTDVLTRIRAEGIPIESIQNELSLSRTLHPRDIFVTSEPHRSVAVWLE